MPNDRRLEYLIAEVASPTLSGEMRVVLSRGWEDYHRAEGHDLAYDWASVPVCYVAREHDGVIVGVANGRYSAGVGHLSELMVDRRWRGRGVGSDLLAVFERRCREAGCHKLTVHTERHGRARRFYERYGWSVEATLLRDKGGLDFARLCKFVDAE